MASTTKLKQSFIDLVLYLLYLVKVMYVRVKIKVIVGDPFRALGPSSLRVVCLVRNGRTYVG